MQKLFKLLMEFINMVLELLEHLVHYLDFMHLNFNLYIYTHLYIHIHLYIYTHILKFRVYI